MTVNQESLEMNRPVERAQKAPQVEYNAVRTDSLTMFGAAIGGAVLGMLLTLLVLAVINGGTLSFSGGQRLTVLEANLTRVDENVNAVSQNVDLLVNQTRILAETASSLQGQLDTEVATLRSAVDGLTHSSNQFTTFLTALETALSQATQAAGE
jgi:uncharacterized protein YoxC